MGKKLKVITACGEEYFYNYDQEVASVEVVEEEERGLDLIDDKNDYIFAINEVGIDKGYYIKKLRAHFCVFNSDDDEIGFIGMNYGKDARLK